MPEIFPNEILLKIFNYLPLAKLDEVRYASKSIHRLISGNLRKFSRFRSKVAYLQQADFTYFDSRSEESLPTTIRLEEFLSENQNQEHFFEVLVIDASLSENDLTRRFLESVLADVVLLGWTSDTWGFIRRDYWGCSDPSIKDPFLEAILSEKTDRIPNQTIEKGTEVATWIGKFIKRPRLYGILSASPKKLQYFSIPTEIRCNFGRLPTEFDEFFDIPVEIQNSDDFLKLLQAYESDLIVNFKSTCRFSCRKKLAMECWNLMKDHDEHFLREDSSPTSMNFELKASSLKVQEELDERVEQVQKSSQIEIKLHGCSSQEDDNYVLLKRIFQFYLRP